MALTRDEVQHIARLCRLSMTPAEMDEMGRQLSSIMDHFEALQRLDTEGVSPTFHVVGLHSVLREDESRPSMSLEDVLANAPRQQAGQFRVGVVIEE